MTGRSTAAALAADHSTAIAGGPGDELTRARWRSRRAPGLAAVGHAAVTCLGVVIVTFLLVRVIPGDPVQALTGAHGTPAQRSALRAELHLNRPLPEQFVLYIRDLATGRLGHSLIQPDESVTSIVGRTLPVTLSLIAATVLLSSVGGLALGLAGATRRARVLGAVTRLSAIALLATPPFLLGLLLLLVASVSLGLLPAGGWGGDWPDHLRYLILPSLTLSGYLTPLLARAIRQAANEAIEEPWAEAAIARGLPPRRLLIGHVLPNSLLPAVTVLGYNMGALVSGAVVVEAVFALPGIGTELVNAVQLRDYTVIQGIALVTATSVILSNLGADAIVRVLDPRTRRS